METATAFLVFMCRINRTVSAKDRLYTVKANRKYLQYIRDSFTPTSLQMEGDWGHAILEELHVILTLVLSEHTV